MLPPWADLWPSNRGGGQSPKACIRSCRREKSSCETDPRHSCQLAGRDIVQIPNGRWHCAGGAQLKPLCRGPWAPVGFDSVVSIVDAPNATENAAAAEGLLITPSG